MTALGLLSLWMGEALAIWAEVVAAKHADEQAWILKSLGAITVSGLLLVTGYVVTYRAQGSIWLVTAASITSILVVEPVIVWLLFKEAPTHGALAGLTLGAAGLVVTLIWK